MKTTLAALLAVAFLGGCVVTPLPPAVAPPPVYAPAYAYPPPVVLGPPRAYPPPPAVVVAPGWRYRGPGGWWRPYRDPRW
ncbi:hypothetical protein [Accumulibacter sp.]|uniref:hypothetical protein n=1 Tax=Accumulibacter sp. TaxID=2053492 RepID=UPI0025F800B0|nr:hypothetical protein [Accumulibacter sp.]MCM8613639.1 hypothetical protein [Accumulibacter sp.]MCM8637333.1 hypothetical protein [Accumulibacter sp.]MCM8638183.1 hypothetical protein [Accumulibacter sp.]